MDFARGEGNLESSSSEEEDSDANGDDDKSDSKGWFLGYLYADYSQFQRHIFWKCNVQSNISV